MVARLSTDQMYDAISRRDAGFDGVFVFAVRTTGVFCRPGCGARTPKRENVEFFDSVGAAIRAGYRPCTRCRPASAPGEEPEWVRTLMELADRVRDRRLTATDVRATGIDPTRATRYFKQRFGMTFQAYHRARRMARAAETLRRGASVDAAAAGGGFESAAGFRAAFNDLFGQAPTRARDATPVHAAWIESPLGPILAMARPEGVCLLEFTDRRGLFKQLEVVRRRLGGPVVPEMNGPLKQLQAELGAYFAGRLREFRTPIAAEGTPFQEQVWRALVAIPFGETRSYADIARAIGKPSATRAVANANGDNRLAIVIPCHRVIGSDGTLTGYGGGLWRKQWLLDLERGGTLWEPECRQAPDRETGAALRACTG